MDDHSRLRDALRQTLDAFAQQLPGVDEHRVEAMHGARVATRRLREIVPLLQLKRQAVRKLNRRLKRITHTLGTVRELDVLCLLVAEFARANRSTPSALKAVGAAIEQARDQARRQLVAGRVPLKMRRLITRLELGSDGLARRATRDRRSVAGLGRVRALDARIVRRALQLQAAIDRAACLYAPTPLHDVRIALKKLRYAAELCQSADRQPDPDIKTLKEGQDLLGRLHDLQVLVTWTRGVQAALSRPDRDKSRGLAALVHPIDGDCRHLHARFIRDRSKLIVVANRMAARSESHESSNDASWLACNELTATP